MHDQRILAKLTVIKKITIYIILFVNFTFANSAFSQININTYYYIPPTAGCNGVWALENFTVVCQAPFSTLIDPFGCTNITNGTVIGDTLFLQLCDFPCSMTITSDSGFVCVCGTFPTEISTNPFNETFLLFSNNHEWKIKAGLKTNSTLEIFNTVGKKVLERNFIEEIFLSKSNFQTGVLIFKISNGNISKVFKVIYSN